MQVTAETIISRSDFLYLEALAEAYEAALDSDMAFRHDPVSCDRTGECGCPDLPNPVLETMSAAFTTALELVLPERVAREVGRLCVVGRTLAEALTTVGGVRFR